MGAKVLGLMYGVKLQVAHASLDGESDLESFCHDFSFEEPRLCDDGMVLGYMLISDLDEIALPINIAEIEDQDCAAGAKEAWEAFDAYAGGKGVPLDPAQFYLVRTEIG